jgi:predicted nucleotidyltransferase component of viral defense system
VDKPLTQEELKELVSVTAERLRIKYPSIIEKDYYVTHVIHSLSGIENEYFRLIFAGGTCLAKAHKIVKRMSEDVDFKIQLKNTGIIFSKNRLLKELKKFRTQI